MSLLLKFICLWALSMAVASAEVFDKDWTLSIAGQTIIPDEGGAFEISNIVTPDQFGEDGPGSIADFLSDDFLRLTGYKAENGQVTRYVWSRPFQIRDGEKFLIRQADLTFSDTPLPEVEFLRVTGSRDLLTEIGQTVQMTTTAFFADDTLARDDNPNMDVTPRVEGTVYRTTNPRIATVARDGLVTARGFGTVLITAVNNLVSASYELNIERIPTTTVEGIVRQSDQTPVSGAMVEVSGVTTTTNSVGRFVVADVPFEVPNLDVVVTAAGVVTNRSVEPIADAISDVGIILLGEVELDQIVAIDPPNGAFIESLSSATVAFRVPMSQASFSETGFFLISAGADGLLDTADDSLVPSSFSYNPSTLFATLTPDTPIGPNLYRLSVGPPVAELDGTPLPLAANSTFRLFSNSDSDGDGLPDAFEVQLGYDPGVADTDGNGILDGDEDFDGDLVSNSAEILILGTNPSVEDTNEDGILDGDDDMDMDSVLDRDEILAGADPFSVDGDNDGFWDQAEIELGTDPANSDSRPLSIVRANPRLNLSRTDLLEANQMASIQSRPRPNILLMKQPSVGDVVAQPRVNVALLDQSGVTSKPDVLIEIEEP